jgi:cellulose synthase/poly-beta-1,6-N-acetylglucosamine synthase-like glycosyltransferase
MDVLQRGGEQLAPYARGLVLATLGRPEAAPAEADAILSAAERLRVDPLHYAIHHFRLDESAALERAAHWARFGFSEVVPTNVVPTRAIDRLDGLGDVRTFRGMIFDREVTFCAPRFEDLLRLAVAQSSDPEIARRTCIVPSRALRAAIAATHKDELLAEARHRLTRRWPRASANVDLPKAVRMGFVLAFSSATVAAAVAPFFARELLLPFIAVMFLVPALLKFLAAFARVRPAEPIALLTDEQLPHYSILIPLRDEAGMVPLLKRAMLALDYPAVKLDIKFLVEDRSPETVEAVKSLLGDPRFELVVVPDASPRTKPKALNFALPLCRGTHVVVFDAEDIPDPGQLRLAASRFAADPGLDCLQAELVIDNHEESWITALFAGEYAGQFGKMLPFLGRWRLPMPLGGTSNHFRTAALRELGHWDAYNVTEDADLGTRLSRLRYNTDMLASETSEEAPITLGAWMVQRTRWIKGWMQTFIVHNSKPREFLADIGWRNFLFFEIYVGNLILSSLLHTVFIGSFVLRAALGEGIIVEDGVDAAYLVILVVGYGGAVALVVAGLLRRRSFALIPMQILLPVYWALHSIAALFAAHQLLVRPYFWGKTAHGRTRRPRRFAAG